LERGGALGVQRGEGLEELRDFSLSNAVEIPELSVFGIASFIERLVTGVPERLMRFANGPSWNFTLDTIPIALDQRRALMDGAFVKVNLTHRFFLPPGTACSSGSPG
jgi:hypothetical protein